VVRTPEGNSRAFDVKMEAVSPVLVVTSQKELSILCHCQEKATLMKTTDSD